MVNYRHLLKQLPLTLAVLLVLLGLLAACQPAPPPATENVPVEDQATTANSPNYDGKKVFYIDSYHVGYEWSDGMRAGLLEVLDGTGVTLQTFEMDTKRNPAERFCMEAGKEVATAIEAFGPDVVIAADDNAQKCVVLPFLKDTDIPIVFTGVNWDASVYGYPTGNITGMVEVELVETLINNLKLYAPQNKVAYVTVDSETERKVIETYNQLFFNGDLQIYSVLTFDELKEAFLTAQDEADIVLFGTNAGIDRWDEAEAKQFFMENTKVPTGAVYDFLAPYTLMTLAKVSEEQGRWGAETALRILTGTPASSIPVVTNKQGQLILNLDVAARLNVVFPASVLRNASIYPPQTGEGL